MATRNGSITKFSLARRGRGFVSKRNKTVTFFGRKFEGKSKNAFDWFRYHH
jgi:hypothetical protein